MADQVLRAVSVVNALVRAWGLSRFAGTRQSPYSVTRNNQRCLFQTFGRLQSSLRLEKIVDERFGRIPVSPWRPLRQTVHVAESGVGCVDVHVPLRFDIRTGETDAGVLRGIGGWGL